MKKHLWKIFAVISAVLLLVGAGVICYAISPYNPRNVTDADVVAKGTEYTVEIAGVSESDENGFMPVTTRFYFSGDVIGVAVDSDGLAYSVPEKDADICLDLRYCSAYMDYDNYNFCGETYKSILDLERFFETPDRIYNFDIDKLSEYIQDIIALKKQFSGKATMKIYRERCVITEFYIGEEKILEHRYIN